MTIAMFCRAVCSVLVLRINIGQLTFLCRWPTLETQQRQPLLSMTVENHASKAHERFSFLYQAILSQGSSHFLFEELTNPLNAVVFAFSGLLQRVSNVTRGQEGILLKIAFVELFSSGRGF